MQTSDRLRIFRSLGLALAALLLIGGAVLGSRAISDRHPDNVLNALPSSSADLSGDNQGEDASASEDASESPEASEVEDVNDNDANEDVNESEAEVESAAEAQAGAEDASSSAEPLESPDDHGGNSGPGGDDAHDN